MQNELYDNVINAVCKACDVERDTLFKPTRNVPYPQARGLCWYLISRLTNHTSGKIAQITSQYGHTFSGAGVRLAMVRFCNLMRHSRPWRTRWENLLAEFDKRRTEEEKRVKITITVPKGERNCVQFEIKERS